MKPAGFKLERSGTIWSKTYATAAAAQKALERLSGLGYRGAVNTLGGKSVVRLRVDSFFDNPGRKVFTPTASGKRIASVEKRVASALAGFLKRVNPAMRTVGAKVEHLAGGALKITPIRNPGRGQGHNVFLRNWYRRKGRELVPDSRGKKTYLARGLTAEAARAMAMQYNATHEPGPLSRKAEWE